MDESCQTTGAIAPAPDDEAHVLAGTPRHALRPIEPGDRCGLIGLFERMSPQSRYRRFLSVKQVLTPRELAYFSEIDHVNHEAFVAVDQRDGSISGVARYVHDGRPGEAELAVAVADDVQNRGIGTALVRRTIERAKANGLEALTATTLWENGPARAMLRRLRFHPVAADGPTIKLELELAT